MTNNSFNILITKIFFTFFLFFFLIFFSYTKPKILIIHKSNPQENWVKNFNIGFERSIPKHVNPNIKYQYLNLKSDISDVYKLKLGILARQISEQFNPDIIILADQETQELLGQLYIDNPNKSLIFCKIDIDPKDFDRDNMKNVTGIFEKFPIQAFKEILPFLQKNLGDSQKTRIAILGDTSIKSQLLKKKILIENWTPYTLTDLKTVFSFEEWKNAVETFNREADFCILTCYTEIYLDPNNSQIKNTKDLIEWTLKNIKIPIIGLDSLFIKDGGEISLTFSPLGEGEAAAKIVHQLLRGEKVKNIPFLQNETYFVHLNHDSINPISLHLPSIYWNFSSTLENYK